MDVYLVFFGKSSDFTIYAFNEKKYVEDFTETIFPDFNLLESKFLINDQIDNGTVLAKYHFEYLGKNYSMIKIYDCAIAKNANRISGSSYGVAILSDLELILSNDNINLLKSVKNKFKELVIENHRFVETTFFKYVEQIWRVFSEKGYFKSLDIGEKPQITSNSLPAAIVIPDFQNIFKFDKILINKFNKFYFTSDLEHVKRSIKYLGIKCPVFTISNGLLIEHNDLEENYHLEETNNSAKLESQNFNLTEENNILNLRLDELEHKLNVVKKYRIVFWVSFFLFLSCLIIQNSIIRNLDSKLKNIKVQKLERGHKSETTYKVLKFWNGKIDINSIQSNEIFLSKQQYNNIIINSFKLKPFVDKDGNTHSNKFIMSTNKLIPEFKIGQNGFIVRLSTEEKKEFK